MQCTMRTSSEIKKKHRWLKILVFTNKMRQGFSEKQSIKILLTCRKKVILHLKEQVMVKYCNKIIINFFTLLGHLILIALKT